MKFEDSNFISTNKNNENNFRWMKQVVQIIESTKLHFLKNIMKILQETIRIWPKIFLHAIKNYKLLERKDFT